MNTIGTLFRLTDFGESHGPAIGGVVDGMPAGIEVDMESLRLFMNRRRPGGHVNGSRRSEKDEVEFLSGIFEGRTLGTPIGFLIRNNDTRPADYSALEHAFRPGHGDYTYFAKYSHRDYRGGGRASARETAVRVVGGALAKMVLRKHGIEVHAYASQIGTACLDRPSAELDFAQTETSPVACPDAEASNTMLAQIEQARRDRNSIGGIVSCVIKGVPAGLGEPVFGKLQAMLAYSMMSINAARGVEFGDGFNSASQKGTESIDILTIDSQTNAVTTHTNHCGGIQAGISNGADITISVAFKPVATLPRPITTIDDNKQETVIEIGGRHDCCVVPRAVAVVEAMAAMTILDALMLHRSRTGL